MTHNDCKNILISFLVVGSLLASLFFISTLEAQQPQTSSNTSTSITNLSVTPQSQTELHGGDITTLTGSLNNKDDPNNSCAKLGDSYGLATYTENTSKSFKDYRYFYYNIISVPWGGPDIITSVSTDYAYKMLNQPATYDIQCMINQPQVKWRKSP